MELVNLFLNCSHSYTSSIKSISSGHITINYIIEYSIFIVLRLYRSVLAADDFHLLPAKSDPVFPYRLDSPPAKFRHVFPLFNLLQRLLGLIGHVRFTVSYLDFHDDAGLLYILGNNGQVKAPVSAFPVRFPVGTQNNGLASYPRFQSGKYPELPDWESLIHSVCRQCLVCG